MKSSGQAGPAGESSLVMRLKVPRKRSPVAGRRLAGADWGKRLHQCSRTALNALKIAAMLYNDWVIPNFSNPGRTRITWRARTWVCPICDSGLQRDSRSQTGWCWGFFSESCGDWGSWHLQVLPIYLHSHWYHFCLVIWLLSPYPSPPALLHFFSKC